MSFKQFFIKNATEIWSAEYEYGAMDDIGLSERVIGLRKIYGTEKCCSVLKDEHEAKIALISLQKMREN